MASIVKPKTILAWHPRLVAKKFDGSKCRKYPGRPRIASEVEDLIVRFARENRSWGYDRIVGALADLGYEVSDQTVGNFLKRHGVPPAPEREKTTPWKELIRSHMDVLAATDFFTTEIWTKGVLVTCYVLFYMHVATRKVHVAGITPCPHEEWMIQNAPNVSMADVGFLSRGWYLIHDRDSKYSQALLETLKAVGIQDVTLPAQSPNLNAFAERWVRSVKEKCLSKRILLGEASLRRALRQLEGHLHHERPHTGRGNVILFPDVHRVGGQIAPLRCRERLGGLLMYDYREGG